MRLRPPVYFLAAIALQVLAAGDLPLVAWDGAAWPWVAGAVAVLAILWILWALALFRRHRTSPDPFAPSTALIVTGPYRRSRNPIYLGMTALLLAIALKSCALTPFLVVPLFALVVDRRFVRPEERKLGAAFGQAFASYAARVRRWL